MATEEGSGGTVTAVSSGSTEDSIVVVPKSKDVVSYESHSKLLAEKKRQGEENALLKAKLAEIEAVKQAEEESRLVQEKNTKGLIELKEKQLKDSQEKGKQIEQRFNLMKQEMEASMKLDSLLNEVPIKKKYWAFLPVDKIALDEHGVPDETSVKAVASMFVEQFPESVEKSNGKSLPNGAAANPGAGLTYEQWLTLPLKDKRKRLGEVMQAKKN